jgi:SAM-dependent methyltransferase
VQTDKAWKRFGDVDPYYGVLTEPEYSAQKMTDAAKDKFFRTGEACVSRVLAILREIDPAFSPRRSLDFGCGVGRLAIPLAKVSGSAVGVDVAPGMLAEARKNAAERGAGNISFAHAANGQFDLVHTHIVLQHIPPRRGLGIVADLAARVNPGGMLVLQVPYHRDASAVRKLATVIKRVDPVINTLANLLGGRRLSYPTMTMFCYDVPAIFTILRRSGLADLRVRLDAPDQGYVGLTLYGQRAQS